MKNAFDYQGPGKIKGLVKAAKYVGMNTDGLKAEYSLSTKTKKILVIVEDKVGDGND